MMISTRTIVVFCAIFSQIVTADKLPSNLIKCSRKDKDCLKHAIEDALPKFAKGIRSMNIPALDPLIIPKMVVPGGTGAVRLTQSFSDCQLIGLSKMKSDDVNFDFDAGRLLWNFHIPKLFFRGNYIMSGQVLVFPVNGNGPMELALENVTGEGITKLEKFTKNNEQYFKVVESSLKLDAGLVKFDFKNLFDGNEQLSKQINSVLNENWREVFDEMKDQYNKGYAVFTDNIANLFFARVPINEIFSD